MIITIDGPSASGKSTVARMLAHRLGYYYLSTGLIYRSIAYNLINKYGYRLETLSNLRQEDIKECADSTRLRYEYNEGSQEHIFFDNHDITPYLKDKQIDQATSLISVNKYVRNAVTTIQHAIAHDYNIVIEGRDVGSVVFPHAQVKFFLTASIQARAERWRKDQEKYNNYLSQEEAVRFITERDERDKNRTIAPLIVPQDAIVVDNSFLDIEQTVIKMISIVSVYLSEL